MEHVKREQNSVGHEHAQLAKRTKHVVVWPLHVPVCVEPLIAQECNLVSEY